MDPDPSPRDFVVCFSLNLAAVLIYSACVCTENVILFEFASIIMQSSPPSHQLVPCNGTC